MGPAAITGGAGGTMKHLHWLAVAALILGTSSNARAQGGEITLVAPGGIRAAIEQLIPGFEKQSGRKVKATFGSGLGTKAQVTRRDAFDVPFVQPPYPGVLASRNVAATSSTPLANLALATP